MSVILSFFAFVIQTFACCVDVKIAVFDSLSVKCSTKIAVYKGSLIIKVNDNYYLMNINSNNCLSFVMYIYLF